MAYRFGLYLRPEKEMDQVVERWLKSVDYPQQLVKTILYNYIIENENNINVTKVIQSNIIETKILENKTKDTKVTENAPKETEVKQNDIDINNLLANAKPKFNKKQVTKEKPKQLSIKERREMIRQAGYAK